jgi:hypothetical protein
MAARGWFVGMLLSGCVFAPVATAESGAREIPHFARRYGVTCQQCHVSPPKLNEFGEAFVANGYSMPSLVARRAIPIALWVSGRSEDLAGVTGRNADGLRAYLNRVEAISGGRIVAPWLSYFVEWRAVSQESRSDGSLRDRSGRFEDLYAVAAVRQAEFTVGQFRQIGQVDVSRRLGLSEPLVLSASLAGSGGGSGRERSLRGFSPAGRSPAVRAAVVRATPSGGWRWTTAGAIPVPGEFSIPLNDEARVEASNEIEWRRKGVVLESFVRRGLTSFGGHAFYDDGNRYLANVVSTGRRSDIHWTAIAGAWRSGVATRGQWSLETEYLPSPFIGIGGRVEDRAGDGQRRAFLPYLNAHFPGTTYTVRLTIERRWQRGREATFVELGTVF